VNDREDELGAVVSMPMCTHELASMTGEPDGKEHFPS
jgi:hypothetical protein